MWEKVKTKTRGELKSVSPKAELYHHLFQLPQCTGLPLITIWKLPLVENAADQMLTSRHHWSPEPLLLQAVLWLLIGFCVQTKVRMLIYQDLHAWQQVTGRTAAPYQIGLCLCQENQATTPCFWEVWRVKMRGEEKYVQTYYKSRAITATLKD